MSFLKAKNLNKLLLTNLGGTSPLFTIMPKHEEFNEQQELNLFFNTTVPPAGSEEAKKLVDEAPYHPGYEGAIVNLTTEQIKPLVLSNGTVTLEGWHAQNTLVNVDPKPEWPTQSIDWSKLIISSNQDDTLTATNPKLGSALKFDNDKLPVNLLSTEALNKIAAVLKFGADKYHAHNWRNGFAWSRPLAAAMRHIMAFNDGEDKDPESGLSHLAHAACCIMFLLEFEKTHPHLDDRYKVDVSKTKEPSK